MGQQQLLLIVLGVIVVGIAIAVGISLFNANSVNSNRDAVVSDLNNIGALAISYYKKPTSMGGGGRSFTAFEIPTNMQSNPNGTYSIKTAGNSTGIAFTGTGNELVGTTPLAMDCAVDSTGKITITKVN